jgi:tRNA wybutosine-synthesizing protein 2
VERERAEEARSILRKKGALDERMKILEKEGDILIPISHTEIDFSSLSGEMMEVPPVPREVSEETPYDAIVRSLDIPAQVKEKLPRKWELVGDILILKLDSSLKELAQRIAERYAGVLGAKTVLEDVGGIGGEFREPRFRTIMGEETTTIHKENGVRYKLDVTKVMFSSGNIHERLRMARVCEPGETVVDMFAGIGYFSLPMAVHSSPAEVICIEKNPVAYSFLEENAHLNRVEDLVRPLFGDCRENAPENVADRVIMGYLRDTASFLPKAMSILKGKGIIHYHEACPDELLPDRPRKAIEQAARDAGKAADIVKMHRIKSYAPGVSHVVFDVRIS